VNSGLVLAKQAKIPHFLRVFILSLEESPSPHSSWITTALATWAKERVFPALTSQGQCPVAFY
jgi:hypothetical protein